MTIFNYEKYLEQFSKNMVYYETGLDKCERITAGVVVILGVGALGAEVAKTFCRAGVKEIILVDYEKVEAPALRRDTIFNEEDVKHNRYKADAAVNHLMAINQEVTLRAICKRVDSSNIEDIIKDVDLVLDCTNDIDTHGLINKTCHKMGMPWVYAEIRREQAVMMNIIPGKTPCLDCITKVLPHRVESEEANLGILNMLTGILAYYQASEGLKLLAESEMTSRSLLIFDIWKDKFFDELTVPVDSECLCQKY